MESKTNVDQTNQSFNSGNDDSFLNTSASRLSMISDVGKSRRSTVGGKSKVSAGANKVAAASAGGKAGGAKYEVRIELKRMDVSLEQATSFKV